MSSTASGMESTSSVHSRRRKSGQLFNGPVELPPAHSTNHSSDEHENDDDDNADVDGEGGALGIDDRTLTKYLDGMHCFDEICTELEVSEKELTARLKRYPGEVVIINR